MKAFFLSNDWHILRFKTRAFQWDPANTIVFGHRKSGKFKTARARTSSGEKRGSPLRSEFHNDSRFQCCKGHIESDPGNPKPFFGGGKKYSALFGDDLFVVVLVGNRSALWIQILGLVKSNVMNQ